MYNSGVTAGCTVEEVVTDLERRACFDLLVCIFIVCVHEGAISDDGLFGCSCDYSVHRVL